MSSFFDDASLVQIPSGYKVGTLFSVKPTDGTGDLTFTRSNDTATRVNSDGLIQKVRTNVLLQSNTFTTTWTLLRTGSNGLPVITSGFTDPNGGSNAYRFEITAPSADNDYSIIQQTPSFSGITNTPFVQSIYVKANGVGQIGKAFDMYCYQDSTLSYRSVENFVLTGDWQRVQLFHTFNGPGSTMQVNFGKARSSAGGSTLADMATDVLIFQSQVELGDIATDYIPTTTTAVSVGPVANLPRLDYTDSTCPKLLLEPQCIALNYFSEQMDNAWWTKSDVTIVANTTDTLDPSGYYGADKVVEAATTARHRVMAGSITIAAVNNTASVFLKKGTARYGFVTLSGAAVSSIVVDLEDGTITSSSTAGTIVAQKVESYANGWYRISLTALGNAVTGSFILQFGSAGSATPSYTANIPTFTGSTSNHLYAWGANIAATSYLQSYIPTLSAASTRGQDDMDTTFASAFATDGSATFFLDLGGAPLTNQNSSGANFALYFSSNDYIAYNHNGSDFHRIRVQVSGGANYITTSIPINTAVKICASVTASTATVYANGTLVGTSSITGEWAVADALNTNIIENAGIISLKQALIFPTALTSTQMAELTA